jgi:BlaI family transcriptional regulator, penicillinase repressor
MKANRPSELELTILALLWQHGPMTVRAVLEALPDRKQRAYTSVLSVMQVMEKKGFLKRTREGMTDIWRPAMRREKIMGPFLKKMVSQLFAGRPSAVLQQLLQGTTVDPEEIQSIKQLIREYETQLPDEKDLTP